MAGIFSPLKKPLKDEAIDQGAHMLHSVLLMLAIVTIAHPLIALFVVMVEALVIELKAKSWDITRVGRRDLAFYFLAASIFIAAYYAIT